MNPRGSITRASLLQQNPMTLVRGEAVGEHASGHSASGDVAEVGELHRRLLKLTVLP